MRARDHIAVLSAVLTGLALLACTSGHGDCGGMCQSVTGVTLDLSCAPAAVTKAVLTGPCAPTVRDAAPSDGSGGSAFGFSCATAVKTPFVDCSQVYFDASGPGVCHVELTFADGFTYSADVTYSTVPPYCGCPSISGLVPSPATLTVNNPSATCGALDAGGG
jgi:hypothetical protein